jgi:hypothetical protein
MGYCRMITGDGSYVQMAVMCEATQRP